MPSPKKPLRILCFGDSLTAGYYGRGTGYQPYSEVLTTKLRAAFPNRDVAVFENGMPGDVVSFGAFTQRLGEECKSAPSLRGHRLQAHVLNKTCERAVRRAKAPFDWVIILGGTK